MKLSSVFSNLGKVFFQLILILLLGNSLSFAQSSEGLPFLSDRNGDEVLNIDAFGDSITRGVGDFTSPGDFVEASSSPIGEAGYPLRIEQVLGIPVRNLGQPGERESETAVARFVNVSVGGGADIAIISGGSNDAFFRISTNLISRTYQTLINIARVSGIQAVLATLPPTCCDRAELDPFIQDYNRAIRDRGFINDVPVADIERAYESTCFRERCQLLNIPEGLHPNSDGYDVSGEVIAATLLEIDLFTPAGQSELADALNISADSIRTIPDSISPTSESLTRQDN